MKSLLLISIPSFGKKENRTKHRGMETLEEESEKVWVTDLDEVELASLCDLLNPNQVNEIKE